MVVLGIHRKAPVANLKPGDVIVKASKEQIESIGGFFEALGEVKKARLRDLDLLVVDTRGYERSVNVPVD